MDPLRFGESGQTITRRWFSNADWAATTKQWSGGDHWQKQWWSGDDGWVKFWWLLLAEVL